MRTNLMIASMQYDESAEKKKKNITQITSL